MNRFMRQAKKMRAYWLAIAMRITTVGTLSNEGELFLLMKGKIFKRFKSVDLSHES